MTRVLSTHTPALPSDTHRSPYTPGPVRRSTDDEHAAIAAFVDRHPEYARLSCIELATLAATYRGPERDAEMDALEDAGVPLDWHRTGDADDFYDEALV